MKFCKICGKPLDKNNSVKKRRLCKLCKSQIDKKYDNNLLRINSTYYRKIKFFENVRVSPKNELYGEVQCRYCGNWFIPKNKDVKKRIQYFYGIKGINGEHLLYCSTACKLSCPIYNQKLYPKEFKVSSSREVNPQFRQMVFERDNYTCQKCGKSKNDDNNLILHCHHIIPYVIDPILDCDIDNGLTLCKNCHIFVHMNNLQCNYSELKC